MRIGTVVFGPIDNIIPAGAGNSTIDGNFSITSAGANDRTIDAYNSNGGLEIQVDGATGDVEFWNTNSSGAQEDQLIDCPRNSGNSYCAFFYNNSKVAEGSATGFDVTGDMYVSGAGPHAFGAALSGITQFLISGSFTSDGSGTSAYGLVYDGQLTGANGDTGTLSGLIGSVDITTQGNSETIANVGQMTLSEPNITKGTDTITNAYTLRIVDAPTEGTNNYALFVDSGETRLDGDVTTTGDVSITSSETTGNALDVVANSITTGNVIDTEGGALTTGKVAYLYSNSADNGTRELVTIENVHTSAINAINLEIIQSAASTAMTIDNAATTSDDIFTITSADALTTGSIASLASNASSTGTRSLLKIANDNTAATGASIIEAQQDANAPFFKLSGASNGAGSSVALSTDTGTAGAKYGAIKVETPAGTKWIRLYDAQN